MERALILLATICFLGITANSQKSLTGREIYRINRNAVVQIYVGGNFSGNGFIVSADGVVITANHVVTTRESNLRQYAVDIKVLVNGSATPYPATPLAPKVNDDQVNYDSAVLKIKGSDFSHVTLGTWEEVEVGDQLTILPTFPGTGPMMIQGIVSNRTTFQIPVLGPKPVQTILFQAPIRKGFSGSPIFSSNLHYS